MLGYMQAIGDQVLCDRAMRYFPSEKTKADHLRSACENARGKMEILHSGDQPSSQTSYQCSVKVAAFECRRGDGVLKPKPVISESLPDIVTDPIPNLVAQPMPLPLMSNRPKPADPSQTYNVYYNEEPEWKKMVPYAIIAVGGLALLWGLMK